MVQHTVCIRDIYYGRKHHYQLKRCKRDPTPSPPFPGGQALFSPPSANETMHTCNRLKNVTTRLQPRMAPFSPSRSLVTFGLLPLYLSGHRFVVVPGTKVGLPNQRQRLQPRGERTIFLPDAPPRGLCMRRRRRNTSHVTEARKAFEARVRRPTQCPL